MNYRKKYNEMVSMDITSIKLRYKVALQKLLRYEEQGYEITTQFVERIANDHELPAFFRTQLYNSLQQPIYALVKWK